MCRYVLIKARRGILSNSNTVCVFDMLDDAQDEMVRQVHEYLNENFGDEMLCVDWDITADSAYVEPCNGYEWRILEVWMSIT